MLPIKAIEEFKKIYQAEEGISLTDAEAEERANSIFDLFLDLTTTRKLGNNEISAT